MTADADSADDDRRAPEDEDDDSHTGGGGESKNVLDALVGVTQVLSRRALLEVAYSYSKSDGYLNDPYKLLSVLDPLTGRPASGTGVPGLYRFELRPDARTRQSAFTELRYAFDRDSLALNYRFMHDDWGITSHTVEGRYRLSFGNGRYLEPHLRYYRQSEADFYRPYLLSGEALPDFASADYRLAKLSAYTAGAKYGWRTSLGDFSARLEYYHQSTSTRPGEAFGALTGLDLHPPLKAIIFQIGYQFGF
jgi:hypothetical protein